MRTDDNGKPVEMNGWWRLAIYSLILTSWVHSVFGIVFCLLSLLVLLAGAQSTAEWLYEGWVRTCSRVKELEEPLVNLNRGEGIEFMRVTIPDGQKFPEPYIGWDGHFFKLIYGVRGDESAASYTVPHIGPCGLGTMLDPKMNDFNVADANRPQYKAEYKHERFVTPEGKTMIRLVTTRGEKC